MLPLPRFQLHRPHSVDEAVHLLERFGAEAMLIAGGTDIVPNMKQGLVGAKHLVSLQGVHALEGIHVRDGAVHVGAMTTLDTIAANASVREHAAALAEAAGIVGSPHHRRMGTLGGNLCLDTRCRYFNQTYFWRSALGFCLKKDGTLCHVVAGGQKCVAAASNDTGAAVIALEGTLTLLSPGGSRTIAARDFYTADGIRNTVRADGEVLTSVAIPIKTGRRSAYEKLRYRNSIDFPMLSLAARTDSTDAGLAAVEVVVSALAARPRRLAAAAKIASGTAPGPALVEALTRASLKECHPLENIEGDADWRHEMVPVVMRKLLTRVGLAG